ncbi:MAG: tetratricopeptide repeat protein [Acidobacteriaceae bacterium]|nr:tetratricopeptide repeat protein [Acidobacteriaceae bacterium]MBV8570739.1 tetratricopeptide repeat protein [Acidobacteriaceae bacterium]
MISFIGLRLACVLVALPQLMPGWFQQTQTPLDSSTLRASASVPGVVKPAPTPPITNELRGDIYMARKMYREAIDKYRECGDSAVIANKIGIAFHQLMLLDLARKNYEHAIKLDPKFAEAINNLGTIYYAEKSYHRAITYYKRALRYSTTSASIYSNLGAAYFARKDYKRASEYYEQALKLDPDVFEHRGTFGTIMQERTVQELATFHLYLAKMYAKSGAKDRALIYLRKALEEGVKDRDKIPNIPEFAVLKTDPAFLQLLAENPLPL